MRNHGNLQSLKLACRACCIHTLMPAGRSQHRTARAPSPRKAPIWGRCSFGGRPRGMVLLPPYELQRDAGEIRGRHFPRAIEDLSGDWSLGGSGDSE